MGAYDVKCLKVEGRRVCRHRDCIEQATCSTDIFGFRVSACMKHHVCGAKRNEKSPLD